MDFLKFKNKIDLNPFQPLYFLYGEESYYIDELSKYIVDKTIDPAMKDFNFSIIYGKDADYKTVLDAVGRYPMMAEYQVVVLREAQRMRDFAELQSYFANPQTTTVFIIEYKDKIDKRLKQFKLLAKLDTAFESQKVRDYQITKWILSYIKEHGWEISVPNAQMMADHLGTDLGKIVNEVNKMMINKEDNQTIGADDIEKYIGISKEYNVFELQSALGHRDLEKVTRIVRHMTGNERDFPLVMIVPVVHSYFTKIYKMHFVRNASPREKMKALGLSHEFFLKEFEVAARSYSIRRCEEILQTLFTYDCRSKGIDNPSGENGQLVKELMVKIVN
ncbi:DNA polymerase III subunit delta [Membranihabitans maritimus]|uniref:DNA polymerase III subunit delta n=1 Tax=Membranihabitans maritimus TaxID=2904244 RepID=UPI001F00B23E|nr:DNA polymerase III subunit delta [Membranihabitans maritimus]